MSPKKIHKYGLYLLRNKRNKIYNKKFENKDDIIKIINEKYNYISKNIMPKNFYNYPKKRCIIKPVPKKLEDSNGIAYYNTTDNTFYINLKKKKELDIKTLDTLILHETIPGHHYQYQYMKDMKLPLYKIYGYNNNNSYIEGWALYCENLNPENKYSYIYEELRIIRLIVDTGINYYGWSYKKAYKFMKKNLSLSIDNIKEELERYISIPGQALSYELGKKNILYLKKLFINKYKLGDIKDFHEFFLEDGVVPFTYLKQKLLNKIN